MDENELITWMRMNWRKQGKWEGVGKTLKVVKKTIVKPGMKVVTRIFKKLFQSSSGGAAATGPMAYTEEPAFMTFIIKVNPSKPGWQRSIVKVLQNCDEGVRFKMDGEGIVEISGVSNPNKLLKKMSMTRNVELHWFQFGQCSTNLFMPEPPKSAPKKQDDNLPKQQQEPIPLPLPPPPLDPNSRGDDYAYHHQNPHHQLHPYGGDDYAYQYYQNPHQLLPYGGDDYAYNQYQNPYQIDYAYNQYQHQMPPPYGNNYVYHHQNPTHHDYVYHHDQNHNPLRPQVFNPTYYAYF